MDTLQQQIKTSIKDAMLAKDSVRLEVLRGISAAMTNDLVAKGRTPQEALSDEEVIAVITKLAKQRKDSIEQFQKGGRADLVTEETAQLAILETYLPKLMDRTEIETLAKAKQAELGITDPTKKGMLMASLMKDLKGKADGMDVKAVVDSLF
ncbi:GatB/YqeY domain-containing protein [Candidatus Nomurabacteria bacterium]|nr:MAG: GatB/YqeY domain-containing protein [Candidatus Nomurabacteria bacterium]